MGMSSSLHASKIPFFSMSMQNGEYSTSTAAMGAIAAALRIESAETSEREMYLKWPSSRRMTRFLTLYLS
jgi:hypothetical protein